jgi:hypothetical protein
MRLWCWLLTNSAAIQGIAALVSMALTLITILVLVVTWKAIKRQALAAEEQAAAARALTTVAEEQTKAAVDAAESARKQSELLSSQLEQSTAPLLVAEPDDRNGMKNVRLVNRGPGVAFKIYYFNGPMELLQPGATVRVLNVQPSTLGPGNSVYLPIPPGWDVTTVVYKGTDRMERFTIIYGDRNKPQEHVVTKGLQRIYLS